jgi:ATP-dependent DNA helicase RecG
VTAALDSPLTALAGVGPALAAKLERLQLQRVEDLLFLLPLRYEDRTQLVRLGALAAGERCLVSGEVLLAETTFRGRRNLLVRISDGSGQLTLRFFHFSRAQQAQFRIGVRVTCFGEVRKGRAGFEMIHPEYRLLREGQDPAINDSLTPIYPATEGVQQGRLRSLTTQALSAMQRTPPEELLPDAIRGELAMPSLADAILYLHRPPPDADVALMVAGRHPCQQRLAFEELLAHYLSLKNLRALADTESAPALGGGQQRVDAFVAGLPFALTGAQQRVTSEILADMAAPHPMMRLIQGDVGSGKTVVAAIACLKAMACGVQAAVMAPTELLAEQHWKSFSDWFRPLGLEPAWLAGSQKTVARREALAAIGDRWSILILREIFLGKRPPNKNARRRARNRSIDGANLGQIMS